MTESRNMIPFHYRTIEQSDTERTGSRSWKGDLTAPGKPLPHIFEANIFVFTRTDIERPTHTQTTHRGNHTPNHKRRVKTNVLIYGIYETRYLTLLHTAVSPSV